MQERKKNQSSWENTAFLYTARCERLASLLICKWPKKCRMQGCVLSTFGVQLLHNLLCVLASEPCFVLVCYAFLLLHESLYD